MNKVIKKYMMAVVAVMLVIGFSAFKVISPPNQIDGGIFEVNPQTGEISDRITAVPAECRNGLDEECAIWLDSQHLDSEGNSMLDNLSDLTSLDEDEYEVYKKNI